MTKPKILILGHARHGKDTVAEMLRDHHGYSFRSSSLFLAEKVVIPELEARGIFYDDFQKAYEDRKNLRAEWREIIAAYNTPDASRLATEILAEADIYVGMRTKEELAASRHLFNLVVWVDSSARNVPAEPPSSMSIQRDAAMQLIENNGSLDALLRKVDQLAVDTSWQGET